MRVLKVGVSLIAHFVHGCARGRVRRSCAVVMRPIALLSSPALPLPTQLGQLQPLSDWQRECRYRYSRRGCYVAA